MEASTQTVKVINPLTSLKNQNPNFSKRTSLTYLKTKIFISEMT